jgi:hypothetical protein
MMYKPGIRVGAILGTKGKTVEFLGYGVYVGDVEPNDAIGAVADAIKGIGCPNPKIELDNGKVVWGCECWWGPEEDIRRKLEEYESVEEVDIDEVRKAYLADEQLQIQREQRKENKN